MLRLELQPHLPVSNELNHIAASGIITVMTSDLTRKFFTASKTIQYWCNVHAV